MIQDFIVIANFDSCALGELTPPCFAQTIIPLVTLLITWPILPCLSLDGLFDQTPNHLWWRPPAPRSCCGVHVRLHARACVYMCAFKCLCVCVLVCVVIVRQGRLCLFVIWQEGFAKLFMTSLVENPLYFKHKDRVFLSTVKLTIYVTMVRFPYIILENISNNIWTTCESSNSKPRWD